MILLTAATITGIACSVLSGFLVHLTTVSRRRAEALEEANRKIEKEIRERSGAEEKLLESEGRFRSAFEQAPHGMCLSGADGGLLPVNRAFCEMAGRSEEELLGAGWSAVTHPEDLGVSHAAVLRLLSGEVSCLEFEKRYIGGRGNVISARVKTSLLHDREGQPLHFVTHVEDVTGRKGAELALLQREERFRSAFEYAPFGLALVAGDRRILQVNATGCRMLGYSDAELLAVKWEDLTHPDDVAVSRQAMARLERDQPEWVEYEERVVGYFHFSRQPDDTTSGSCYGSKTTGDTTPEGPKKRLVVHFDSYSSVQDKRIGRLRVVAGLTGCSNLFMPRQRSAYFARGNVPIHLRTIGPLEPIKSALERVNVNRKVGII
jgi:PAS domain S-box-containing protein